MKTIKLGLFESTINYVWKEGIEVTIPDDMTPAEYINDLRDNDPDGYESLMEQINEMDVSKDKIDEDEHKIWFTENGDESLIDYI